MGYAIPVYPRFTFLLAGAAVGSGQYKTVERRWANKPGSVSNGMKHSVIKCAAYSSLKLVAQFAVGEEVFLTAPGADEKNLRARRMTRRGRREDAGRNQARRIKVSGLKRCIGRLYALQSQAGLAVDVMK